MNRLFVYGSLQPGESNAHVLEHLEGEWAKGTIVGTYYSEGWGANMGYPGVRLHPGGDTVPGHVLTSADLVDAWAELDAFEGKDYQRVYTEVTLESGETVEAQLYIVRD